MAWFIGKKNYDTYTQLYLAHDINKLMEYNVKQIQNQFQHACRTG